MSPRGLAIMAAVCLIAGLVVVASGIGVGLAPVSRTFPLGKGPLVVDCGQPWPPRGSDRSFIIQPGVMQMLESIDSPGMKEIALSTIEADCSVDRGLKTNLMIGLGVGGVVLAGLGAVLLLVRNLRGRQRQQWPPVR
ncbi:MAG TPA: hypothetical protein VGD48_28435 [Kutzneria sp.]